MDGIKRTKGHMNIKTIRQTVKFPAPPRAVYDLLMDSRKHKSLSGEAARISKRTGGNSAPGLGTLLDSILY
jgi:hypothetical protein